MTVARAYRITFKQRNCTVTIKQDKITDILKTGTNNEVSFVEIILHSWQFMKEKGLKGWDGEALHPQKFYAG